MSISHKGINPFSLDEPCVSPNKLNITQEAGLSYSHPHLSSTSSQQVDQFNHASIPLFVPIVTQNARSNSYS